MHSLTAEIEPLLVIPLYVSDHTCPGFHGIQVWEDFFLSYFLDTVITVGRIGQVEKMEGPLSGINVQLIGWTFVVIATTLDMILMTRPNFWRQIWHSSSAWRALIWIPKGILRLLICTRPCAPQVRMSYFIASIFHQNSSFISFDVFPVWKTGLRNVLIPYRYSLLRLKAGQSRISMKWATGLRLRGWAIQPRDFSSNLSKILTLWLSNIKWKLHNLNRM